MLKLSDMAKVGRKVRQDDWADLGQATPAAVADLCPDELANAGESR